MDKYLTADGLKSKTGQYKDTVWETGGKFVQGDILALPFADDYADLIECHQVLEHFQMKDVVPALKEMRRVLKPGGEIIITVPSFAACMLEFIRLEIAENSNINDYIYIAQELYGNQIHNGEFHKCPMTVKLLKWFLTQAGFTGGTVAVFPRNEPIPKKGVGLASNIGGKMLVWRSETIFLKLGK